MHLIENVVGTRQRREREREKGERKEACMSCHPPKGKVRESVVFAWPGKTVGKSDCTSRDEITVRGKQMHACRQASSTCVLNSYVCTHSQSSCSPLLSSLSDLTVTDAVLIAACEHVSCDAQCQSAGYDDVCQCQVHTGPYLSTCPGGSDDDGPPQGFASHFGSIRLHIFGQPLPAPV